MAQSLVFTHAFGFYYKWAPTGSSVITNLSWSQHYVSGSGPNKAMSGSWYNFPPFGVTITTGSILTRHTSSITDKDGALAWGSAASDLLWNVLTPSMSFSQALDGAGRADSIYRFTYNSESFLRKELLPSLELGVLTYPITSSWIAYEPRMIKYASGSTSTGYVVRGTALGVYFPASINSPATTVYSLPSAYTPPTATYPRVGKNPTNITYGSNSTGSNDGRFFDLAGGCGITRASISASLVQFAASASGISNSEIAVCSAALKKRRLFFPTISTSSSSLATNNPSSWVRLALGKSSNQFFTENGGIYNVKFTLKRDITYDYYPDETQGSELLVYIHNVNAQVPSPSNRILGKNGWYPPEANIVRIKNTPAMAFENPDTGYKLETFNINVVQYGFPAQLVFEASGSLANDGYFGCIIDDVEFCKVGVTTDPGLIKPLNFVDTNTAEYFATKGAVAQPPAPLTGEQQVLLDQANAAAATAQGFATTAKGSATAAEGSATAAEGHATTANTKAGEAASSATTAGNALIAVNQASASAKTDLENVRINALASVVLVQFNASSSLASVRTEASTSLAGVRTEASTSLAGVRTEASGSLATVRTTASNSLATVRTTASGSLATVQFYASSSLVSARNNASSSLASVRTNASHSLASVRTDASYSLSTVRFYASTSLASVRTSASSSLAIVRTNASGSLATVQLYASTSLVSARNNASSSLASVRTNASSSLASVRTSASGSLVGVRTEVSTSIAGFVVQAKDFAENAADNAAYAADEAGAAASEAFAAAGSATIAAASASKAAISAATASKAVTSASLFVYSGSIYMSQSFAYASQSWSTVKGTTASTLYNTTAKNAVAAVITAASSSYAAIKLLK
jgi:hypothetical protein